MIGNSDTDCQSTFGDEGKKFIPLRRREFFRIINPGQISICRKQNGGRHDRARQGTTTRFIDTRHRPKAMSCGKILKLPQIGLCFTFKE